MNANKIKNKIARALLKRDCDQYCLSDSIDYSIIDEVDKIFASLHSQLLITLSKELNVSDNVIHEKFIKFLEREL